MVIRLRNIEAAIQKTKEVEVDSQWNGEANCLQNSVVKVVKRK